ncbi:MAG TPA: hypothetical protein VJ953_19425 [Saprospiraceae bacterium]|nr:hypothetical protein [Saprospiraceae bacterium]
MELLKNLSADEQQQMKDAIAYITILVAGADGNIDKNEISASEKLTKIRSFSFQDELMPYYQEVGKDFSERLDHFLEELPENVEERQEIVSNELKKLNPILAKLSTHYSHIFYDSFVSFARHVAKSSGGIIGFFRVGPEEKQVMDLPMLNPTVD